MKVPTFIINNNNIIRHITLKPQNRDIKYNNMKASEI